MATFSKIGGSAPSYVPKGSGRSVPSVPKYAGKDYGYDPSSFNAQLQGIQDFNNAGPGMAAAPTATNQGPSAQDLAFLTVPPGGGTPPGGGGAGGRRSGGGGAGGGVAPQVRAAYDALWKSQFGNAVGLKQGFDEYEGRLNKAYDPSRINAIYDQAGKGVTSASQAGLARLGPILQGLRDRAATGRTAVNQAYQAGDDRLSAIGADMTGRLQAVTGGLNQSLGAFDAGQIAPSGADSLQNLIAAGRVTNAGMQTASDAALADRPAVYEGLNADVQSGISRDETGLMNQIAMQRASGLGQNEQALQLALAQAGLQRMTAEQQQAAERERLRLELAQAGISVPATFLG